MKVNFFFHFLLQRNHVSCCLFMSRLYKPRGERIAHQNLVNTKYEIRFLFTHTLKKIWPWLCKMFKKKEEKFRQAILRTLWYYYRINVQKVTTPTTPKSKPRFIKWSYTIKLWLKINYQCYYDCKKTINFNFHMCYAITLWLKLYFQS